MCGRFTLRARLNDILAQFAAEAVGFEDYPLLERFNIPPTADIPVLRSVAGRRQLSSMRWGLLPPWTKDLKSAPKLNNARAETVAELPSFRSAFKSRRCIIPVSGFYEWQDDTKPKQPFYFHSTEDKMLAFAGLWETWRKDELTIDSCTIVTTEANGVMSPVHTRMPVIFGVNDIEQWLDPNATDLLPLLTPCPDDELTCYPVSTFVNKTANEGPQCIERVTLQSNILFD